MAISWRDGMAIGDPQIDEDHKKFVTLVNAMEAISSQGQYSSLGLLLEKLGEFAGRHFAREESLMASVGYLDLEAHKALHQQMTKKVRLIAEKFLAANTEPEQKQCSSVLLATLNDYLVNHLLKEDSKLKPFLRQGSQEQSGSLLSDIAQTSEEEAVKRRLRRNQDVEYQLPPHLAHLLRRLEYNIPQLPPPESEFPSFDKLCEAAIFRRIEKVLIFFQRNNPDIVRELPPFFLSSPEFADKFRIAVSKLIFPVIWESRQVRMSSTSFDWTGVDTENFWDHLSNILKESILICWAEGWDRLRLVETKRPDGSKILQVKEPTKILRAMLQPSNDMAYDLPKIGNREIDTFKSLLDTATDWWTKLNNAWKIVNDIYEQEKDPRVFQQKAREGALRDNLLAVFNRFPEQWGDYLVLVCHQVFPRISSQFLESFATNFGRSEQEREAYVPYTIHYLRQVRLRPEIRNRERQEEELWQEQVKLLRNYLTGRTPNEKSSKV